MLGVLWVAEKSCFCLSLHGHELVTKQKQGLGQSLRICSMLSSDPEAASPGATLWLDDVQDHFIS